MEKTEFQDLNFFKFIKSSNYLNALFFLFFFLSIFFFFNHITTILNYDNIRIYQSYEPSRDDEKIDFNQLFYNLYIFDHSEFLSSNREIGGFEGGDGRHKLRWLYRDLETRLFKKLFLFFPKKPLTFYTLLNTLYCFFSFFFTFLTISQICNNYSQRKLLLCGFIFNFFIFLIFFTGYQTIFTLPEMFYISIGIYFSLKSNFFLFLIPLFLAVINRESGIALSFVFIIFNFRKLYSYSLPLIAVLSLLIVNYDLILNQNLYSISTYFPIEEKFITNKTSLASLIFFLFFLFNFLVVLFFIIQKKNSNEKFLELAIISLLYFLIAIFGTNLTNVFSLLLIVPSITILFVFSYEKIRY